jgi:galactokinase
LVAAARTDSQVRLLDVGRASTAKFTLDVAIEPSTGHWSNFPMTVARRLARDFPGIITGVDVVFASDLPRASGMSSSSALIIAVFFALAQANSLSDADAYRRAITSREDLAGYLAAIESGAVFASFAGAEGVGTHGGSEDHVAILCSRAGSLRQYSFCPVRFETEIPFLKDHVFAIGVSGVKADKTGDARELYNRASGTAWKILELWKKATGREDTTLAAAVSVDSGAAGSIRQVIRDSRDSGYTPQLLLKRFDQFVEETSEIVPSAGKSLARGEFERLGAIIDRSQSLAEKLLANQVPETADLARRARELGAVAASAFGAGFGGSVWALVHSESAEEFRSAWAAQYHRRFPERAGASEFFLSPPGPGLVQFE